MEKLDQALRIHLFGPFRALRNGKPLSHKDWPQRKTESLLKVLASRRGHAFTQDQLVDLLFDDLDHDKAVKSLYNRISELRRVLEPNLHRGNHSCYVQRVGPGSYSFAAEADCWIDAEAAEGAFEAGEALAGEGRWAEAAQRYQTALELCAKDYLADDPYEEWTLTAREGWQQRREDLLLALANCHARLGQRQRALACCREVIAQRPTAEEAYRGLMRLAAEVGDTPTVVRAYRTCEAALREHLDVEPATETQQLFQELHTPVPQTIPSLSRSTPLLLRELSAPLAVPKPRPATPGRLSLAAVMMVAVMFLITAAGWWGFSQLTIADHAPSVAVLPLVNIGGNTLDGFWFPLDDFADSTTMELTNALSQVAGLKVAATTSVFALKGKRLNVSQIGEALNVKAVLEGSIRRAVNKMRITLQLIDVNDGLLLWSGKYDVDIRPDAFAMLDEMTPQMIEEIGHQLVPEPTPDRRPLDERLLDRVRGLLSRYLSLP